MADTILNGQKLYVGGRDLSGDWTAMALMFGREALEKTTGGDDMRVFRPGIRTVSFEADGVADLGADLADEELYTFADSVSDVPIIATPIDGAEGSAAYGFRALIGDYEPFADSRVGDLVKFRVSARGAASKLVRGTILHSGNTARTASFNGTARQLGAVSATQKVYACIQVLSASVADTLDVIIGSDNAEGFPSTTARVTFTQKTAAGQTEWVEVSGAITDDWWRAEVTIGGASPSFNFVVLLAIL